MYTKRELNAAKRVISRIARENHVPEAQVRTDIMEAMNAGRSFPDPEVQARWTKFHFDGPDPTVEEFVLWLAAAVKQKMLLL